jgi:hypothetical protein
VIGGHGKGGRAGRDVEFGPETVDVILAVVHAGEFHEVIPCGRVGAISSDEQVECYFNFWVTFFVDRAAGRLGRSLSVSEGGVADCAPLEPRFVEVEVGTDELVVEKECYVGHGFKGV